MTAPRTWDVTLRIVDGDNQGHPEYWMWRPEDMQNPDWWTNTCVEFLSAMEVKTWRFGDVVTEDNKPDVPFTVVNSRGVVVSETDDLSRSRGTWHLIWLDGWHLIGDDGQDLINTVD